MSCHRTSSEWPGWGYGRGRILAGLRAGGEFGLSQFSGTQDRRAGEVGNGAALVVVRQGSDDCQPDGGSYHDDVDQPFLCVGAAGEAERASPGTCGVCGLSAALPKKVWRSMPAWTAPT